MMRGVDKNTPNNPPDVISIADDVFSSLNGARFSRTRGKSQISFFLFRRLLLGEACEEYALLAGLRPGVIADRRAVESALQAAHALPHLSSQRVRTAYSVGAIATSVLSVWMQPMPSASVTCL